MRMEYRRPFVTSLLLVAAALLLAGCGDEGAHLPAGMTGVGTATTGATGDLFAGDPGPITPAVSRGVDDPVLADYEGVDGVATPLGDDPYARAISDWNDAEGSLGAMDAGLDDLGGLDEPLPVGYGGRGYDDGWGSGYGYGYGGGVGTAAVGFADPGFEDPGFVEDVALEDPGFVDGGFDAGFVDAGMDVGFVDAGFDPGVASVGMDAGFVDVGMDVGMDAGIVF